MSKRIAVLALQGAFIEHENMLRKLGANVFEVRQLDDWQQPKAGLVIPGGESTAQLKLLNELGLLSPIRDAISKGLPVFGTCAGLILLAKNVGGVAYHGISTMDIDARRNAYGRQLGSFDAESEFDGIGSVPMTFIRAPYINSILSEKCKPLAVVDGHIVAARQDRQLVTAFHPELTDNTLVHQYFLDMIS
jgi:5'-phosphate synthase pdxT subunit